jgi:ABC-type lipoprotein export system ATPase subunit
MQKIELRQALPKVFAERRGEISSDVWLRDLTFSRGELYLIEAASGTGKSSLCSFVYGYRNDFEGTISFDSDNVKALSVKQWTEVRRNNLSILFQEMRLFGELTALENIEIKNRLTGYKSREEIVALLERMGVADKANIKADNLSFGQQQRVAFVRALCQPFDFVMLDEPISHLDDANGAVMGEILMEELKRRGAGALVTSIGKHIDLPYDHRLRL